MDSAVVLRSFQCAVSSHSHLRTVLEKPAMLTVNNAAPSALSNLHANVCGGKAILSTRRRGSLFVSCLKTSDVTLLEKSNGDVKGAVSSDNKQSLLDKKPLSATFPRGFEDLLTEVCDETKIAEIKVKIGAFEMHMKRNIDGPSLSAPIILQATAPPTSPASTPPPKSSVNLMPFSDVSPETKAKLAKLEASGVSNYVIVASPAVGLFRRSKTLKGSKQPPSCKEGDMIKSGQFIGCLDRFGGDVPVGSQVAGEVVMFLCDDGKAVGYGDPIAAVIPAGDF